MGKKIKWLTLAFLVVSILSLGYVLTRTTTYKRGINFQVYEVKISTWAKLLHFIDRHVQYQEIIDTILKGNESPEERTLKLFSWVHENIRQTPKGFPVIDDHVLNIIIRGYGGNDQVADVFVTLLTYAGVPAKMYYLPAPSGLPRLTVVTVWLNGAWRVMDPYYGNIFRTDSGNLASIEDIKSDPRIVNQVRSPDTHKGVPYKDFFKNISYLQRNPGFNRGADQQPWSRLKKELKEFFGLNRGTS